MSIYPTTTKRLACRRRRGSVSLAAIMALIIAFTIAVGMLTSSSALFNSGKRQAQGRGVRALTEAGIEYGYWQVAFNYQPLPHGPVTLSLGQGSFTVTVTDNRASIAGTIKIVSTANQGGQSLTLTRVERALKTPFDYSLAANSSLSTSRRIILGASGANGDARINGNLSLSDSDSRVNGDAMATGTINSSLVVTGTKEPNAPMPLEFPAIDLNALRAVAQSVGGGRYYGSGLNVGDVTFLVPYEVVYINGNLTLSGGTIRGTGTVVVTGQVIIQGDYTYALPSDKVAVLTTGGFESTTGADVVGFYYGHNGSNTAMASLGSNGAPKQFNVIKGSFACDRFAFGNSSRMTYDSDMSPALARNLHLPGY